VKDDEPLEYALATVRSSIHNIWDRFPDSMGKGQLFLTGKGNFRDKLATIQIYKGNRDPANKPKYYEDIRQYMIDHHPTTVVQGMEAEDRVGILQYAAKDKSTVIVGVDKDLLCIPGWHYNPVKDTFCYVTLDEANTHFWKQVLTGDRVDNIQGIPGMGPKTAEKIIAPVAGNWGAMASVVQEEYNRHFGDDGWVNMDETARLIWILRKEGETYDGSRIT
jgi:DNA polymerase-1